MSEAEPLFSVLRQSADPDAAAAIERLIKNAPDHELNENQRARTSRPAKGSTRSA